MGPRSTLILALLTLSGCQCGTVPFERCEEDEALPTVDAVVWHRHVRPIIEARCTRCHQEGGLAPFALTAFSDVKEHLAGIQHTVVARLMPPFMPARCCGKGYRDDPSLTPAQIATIARWVDDGAPEGDPADVGPALPLVGELPRVDETLIMSEPYLPDVDSHDDTRCFLLDWPFSQQKFVVGFGVTPGVREQVHHALVVLAPGYARDGFRDLDDDDDKAGWSCPGGLVLGIDDYVGGWSPGWEGAATPPGTGHQVDGDDVVILTVHYTRPHDGSAALPDQTSVDFMLADDVGSTLTAVPVINSAWVFGGLPIPKDNPSVLFDAELDPTDSNWGQPVEVVGVNLHMHERGSSGVLGIKRQDGSQECLVQIDAYDHAWQGDYVLQEPVTLQHGDHAYVECEFDNSLAHQRIVDGAPEEPRDLNWGEEQEMCVGYLTVKRPR